ncbi:hypothetical protein pipiens_018685 [Culex pipiens pipiens]|uniref:Uncharacterized protein n=1 Tax=Culex pipiens pipiens TaxID=38569 RepID=A0ABD1CAJ1_CULPP
MGRVTRSKAQLEPKGGGRRHHDANFGHAVSDPAGWALWHRKDVHAGAGHQKAAAAAGVEFGSAADLYIKDYLHPWVEEGGGEEAKQLRVYYYKRWVATVNSIVQKYCLIDLNINVRIFRRPTVENILKYRIVVVSLNISMELAWLDLPKGHFTHIFLD